MKKHYHILTLLLLASLSGCNENHLLSVSADEDASTHLGSRSISDEKIVCGTIESDPPADYVNLGRTRAINDDSYYMLNIFVHVVRSSAGDGLNKESVTNSILENINNYYSSAKIGFVSIGNEYIDSDELNCDSYETATGTKSLFSSNNHTNAIDIYVLSSGKGLNKPNGITMGFSDGVISTNICINSTCYNTTTMLHEIGHCLGLYHTHYGTSKKYVDDGKGKPELVDGSNSEVAGDFITDTPADPCEWANGKYIGTSTDANGDYYNPDPSNLMSYSGASYRNKLTSEQIEKIRYVITNFNVLKNVIHKTQLTGPKHFNGSATYSLSAVNASETIGWTVTAYSNGKSTKTTYGNTQSIELSSTSPTYYEIVATVGSTSLVTYATSNAPSPYVGHIYWETNSGQCGVTDASDYGNTLSISGDFSLNLEYTDKAGNNSKSSVLNGFDFQCVTTSRALHRGSTMTFTPSECKRNLMIRASDACGSSDGYFTIPCQVVNYAYNFDVNADNLSIKMVEVNNTEVNKILAEKDGISLASAYVTGRIKSVTVSDENQKIVYSKDYSNGVENVSISKASWDSGTYIVSISNGTMLQNYKIIIP